MKTNNPTLIPVTPQISTKVMFYCHETTSDHSVIEDAIFGRMDDIGDMFKKEVHEEFVMNVLMKHKTNLFPEYSYLYILVAHSNRHSPSSDSLLPSEKRWSDILNTQQNQLLTKNSAFIIGYMLMTPEHPLDIHFIEYIDSRVPGYNIADCMIKKFENEVVEFAENSFGCKQVRCKCVIPKDILSSSAGYWKKYLDRRLGIHSNEELDGMKKTLDISDLVTWYYLEKAFTAFL